MTLTCAIQTPIKENHRRFYRLSSFARVEHCMAEKPSAFVLAEVVMVLFIVGLFICLAALNVTSLLGKNTFRAQVYDLADTFQKAVAAASQNGRKYEIVIDLSLQNYLLREISTGDLGSDILQEEIIQEPRYFVKGVKVKYVQFDDGVIAAEGQAKFRAGKGGWQFGGKVVLTDDSDNDYSIVVNRLSRKIEFMNIDVEILMPEDDVPF